MNSFDNDMNEDTGSRQSGGSSFRSSANSRLMENSALREAENEAIINVITDVSHAKLISKLSAFFYGYGLTRNIVKLSFSE